MVAYVTLFAIDIGCWNCSEKNVGNLQDYSLHGLSVSGGK